MALWQQQHESSGMLEGELTCAVCLDLFSDPHQLPCGHSFCLPCLQNLQRAGRRDNNGRGSRASSSSSSSSSSTLLRGRVCCPECRRLSHPNTVVRRNFKLANIADHYRQRRERQEQEEDQQQQNGGANQQGPSGGHERESGDAVESARAGARCDFCPPSAEVPSGRSSGPSIGVYASLSSSSTSSSQLSTSSARGRPIPDGGHSGGGDGDRDSNPSSSSSTVSSSCSSAVGTTSPGLAVMTCLKCEVSMCAEHLRPHLELPAFRDHLLVKPHRAPGRPHPGLRRCPQHGLPLRHYCQKDRMCLCGACLGGEHSHHTIRPLDAVLKDTKASVQRNLQTVARKINKVEKTLQDYHEHMQKNKAFQDDVDVRVSELGNALQGQIACLLTALRETTRSFCGTTAPHGSTHSFVPHGDGAGSATGNAQHDQQGETLAWIHREESQLMDLRRDLLILANEGDPVAFLKEYDSTGNRIQRLLRRPLFSGQFGVDRLALASNMEVKMVDFVTVLQRHGQGLIDAIYAMHYEEQLENEPQGAAEEEQEEEEFEVQEMGEEYLPGQEEDDGDNNWSTDDLYELEEEDGDGGKVCIIEVQEAEEENVISFKDVGTQRSVSAPMVWSDMEEKVAQVFVPRSLPTTLGKLPSPQSSAPSSPTPNVSPQSSLDDDVPPSTLHPSPSSPLPPSFPASTLSLPACLPSLPPVLPSSTSTSTSTPPRLPLSLPPVPVPCKARRTFSRLSLLDPPSSLPPSRLEATPSKLPPLDLSVLLKALGASSTRVAPLPPIQVRNPEEREDMESNMESTEESDDEMAQVVVWSCDQEVAEEDKPDQEVAEEEKNIKKKKKKRNSFKNRIVKFFRRLNCFHCGEDNTRDADF